MGDLLRYVKGTDLRPRYDEDVYSRDHPTEEDNVYPIVTKEASEDGLGRQRWLIGQDADPETPVGVIVVYGKEIDGVIELCVRDENNGPVIQLTQGGVLNAGQPGYIQGLVPAYVDGSNLGFGTGAVRLNGKTYELTTAFSNLDCSGLSADTWYYVEITAPGSGDELSVDDFSITNTAPSLSATLHYWERSSKRCVFPFKTDGSGAVKGFVCDGRSVEWFSPTTFLNTSSPATSNAALSVGLPSLGIMKFSGGVKADQSNAQLYKVYMGPYGSDPLGVGSACLIHQSYAPSTQGHTPFKMVTGSQQRVTYATVWNGSGTLAFYLRGYDLPAGMAR